MGNNEARTRADERITRLHDAVPGMQSASSETAIYEAIVETVVSTLGFDACAVSVPDNGVFDERVVSESAPFDEGTRSFRVDEVLSAHLSRTVRV
ncbi:hypothetical protein [Halalkalirubrum salinum]|uniref:hypothetical protein n=1 Tax=Halalkalirubrum salinum TaxID=2563889 RepID=UPI0010FAEEBD|nr:hypothetical protein [Halalkalirubrum salinum]